MTNRTILELSDDKLAKLGFNPSAISDEQYAHIVEILTNHYAKTYDHVITSVVKVVCQQ